MFSGLQPCEHTRAFFFVIVPGGAIIRNTHVFCSVINHASIRRLKKKRAHASSLHANSRHNHISYIIIIYIIYNNHLHIPCLHSPNISQTLRSAGAIYINLAGRKIAIIAIDASPRPKFSQNLQKEFESKPAGCRYLRFWPAHLRRHRPKTRQQSAFFGTFRYNFVHRFENRRRK